MQPRGDVLLLPGKNYRVDKTKFCDERFEFIPLGTGANNRKYRSVGVSGCWSTGLLPLGSDKGKRLHEQRIVLLRGKSPYAANDERVLSDGGAVTGSISGPRGISPKKRSIRRSSCSGSMSPTSVNTAFDGA